MATHPNSAYLPLKKQYLLVVFTVVMGLLLISVTMIPVVRSTQSRTVGRGYRPRIAVSNDGDAFIAYLVPKKVYISSNSFHPTFMVSIVSTRDNFIQRNISSMNASVAGAHETVNIIVDSQGNPHMVWVESRNMFNNATISHLGYWTASKSNLDSGSTILFAENISTSSVVCNPIVRVDSHGKVYIICYILEDEGENVKPVIRIWNSHNNFTESMNLTLSIGSPVTLRGHEMIAAVIDSNNVLHLIWSTLEAEWWAKPVTTKVYHASSADNFVNRTQIATFDFRYDNIGAIIDKNNKIHVFVLSDLLELYPTRYLFKLARNPDGTIEPPTLFLLYCSELYNYNLENLIFINKNNDVGICIPYDRSTFDDVDFQWKIYLNNNQSETPLRPYNYMDNWLAAAIEKGETLHITFEREKTDEDGFEIRYLANPKERDDDPLFNINGYPPIFLMIFGMLSFLQKIKRTKCVVVVIFT